VQDQAAGVADTGEVREELDVFDELDPGLLAALDPEGEHAPYPSAYICGLHAPHWSDALMVVLAGVGNGIAQLRWTRSLSLAPPSAVVPFNYLSLVWAAILGFAVWGDVPTAGLLVGSPIVVASGLYILWRETVRRRRPAVRAPQWA
jgi:hypothetical protein